jgi:CRISPR-associated protein Cmr1
LITPLFGGGVTPGEADPVTVIRGAEVRGHLRFWWRATRGGAFVGDLERMKVEEERIWGSPGAEGKSGPSEISVFVAVETRGSDDHPFEVVPRRNDPQRAQIRARDDSSAHPYAAFPLQPKEGEARIGMETKAVRIGVTFKLTLAYPKAYEADLRAALWAWETFGGIGARTRKGFGALQCVQCEGQAVTPPSTMQVKDAIHAGLQKHLVNGKWPPDVPHLSASVAHFKIIEFGSGTTPLVAWDKLVEGLKRFRQKRRPSSDPQHPERPGRSYWPEPEAIRRLTDQRHPNHDALGPELARFPRAALGLPIIFHFKDQNRYNPQDPRSDPADTTLQGKTQDGRPLSRLASPLILRPLACRDGAVGLAIVLQAPIRPPGGWELQETDGTSHVVEARLSTAEAQRINVEPLKSGQSNVLQAFLETLR